MQPEGVVLKYLKTYVHAPSRPLHAAGGAHARGYAPSCTPHSRLNATPRAPAPGPTRPGRGACAGTCGWPNARAARALVRPFSCPLYAGACTPRTSTRIPRVQLAVQRTLLESFLLPAHCAPGGDARLAQVERGQALERRERRQVGDVRAPQVVSFLILRYLIGVGLASIPT